MKPGQTNGRVARVRDYLARVKTARTPKQILQAVEPEGTLATMCNTLGYMARRGHAEQLGKGRGNVRFRIGKVPVVDRNAIIEKPTPARRTPRIAGTAPGATSSRPLGRVSASEQIAADLAAYQARGGKIERLGVTQIFHVRAADNDDLD